MKAVSSEETMREVGTRARAAARIMARAPSATKNAVLVTIAAAVRGHAQAIATANASDVDAARHAGLGAALLDRLLLSREAIDDMALGLEQVAALPDPVGEMTDFHIQPSGIQVGQMRVPLGVIGMIYEARPDVTIDAAALCIKSGNAAILRGGSEALGCNVILSRLIRTALTQAGLPPDAVQLIENPDRALVGQMARATEYIDVLVPRGGRGLIERLMKEATVPMIKHLEGICHVYLDVSADPNYAIAIADNAKTQRLGTCNTMETLLVHRDAAPTLLPPLAAVFRQKSVELRGCERTRAIIPGIVAATEADWRTEYLAAVLSIRVVDDLDGAIEHINTYGSHHTDAIVTENYSHAMRFLREVDSASVLVNASTRFADGFEFGLGAEIGISNDKLHARGPVGLKGLTSMKYVVFGHGQVRS